MSPRRSGTSRTGGLRLAVRALWFRRNTAVIVFALAAIASASAVVAPLYARAAEESILRDTLSRADAFSLGAHVSVSSVGGGVGLGKAEDGAYTARLLDRALRQPAFGRARLAYAANALYHPTRGEFAGGLVAGQVVERAELCAHLPVTAGRCPTARDEGMLSTRSLTLVGARIGDTIEVDLPDAPTLGNGGVSPVVRFTVVGSFDPVPVQAPYWAGRPYFSSFYPQATPNGLGENPPTADPVFVGPGTTAAARLTTYTVDVPVRPSRVRLGDATALRRQVERLEITAAGLGLGSDSQLPAVLERADDGQRLVRIAAPLAVSQLLLLSWWTLYLVVGSATEERSPELGLAKLRGLSAGQTRRFGLAEVVLLLLVAAPVGTAIGYAAVRGSAGRVFSPGTQVLLTWSVLGTVLVALAGGAVTAAAASRTVFRRPVIELLRRVPPRRGRRRAGLLDAVVVVLAVAGLVQLVADRGGRPSPIATLAPGMVAAAGGLLAARVLVRVARRRAARGTERGQAQTLVGWAAIARRPGTARIASVLAVATALLLVGVQAWTVAERNRHERAAAETGAAVVLDVRAGGSRELLDAVRAADPSGRYAMAVVKVTTSNQDPTLLAVDATRADQVLRWGTPGVAPRRGVGRTLRPPLPAPLLVRPGRLAVSVDLVEAESPSPLRLTARLTRGTQTTRIELGTLRPGARTYEGTIPSTCAAGCRLAAIAVDHPSTDIEGATATLLVRSITATEAGGSPTELATRFASPGAWRPGSPTVGGPRVLVRPGDGLRLQVTAPGGPAAEVVHGDSPEPLPAVVGVDAAGPRAAEGGVPVGRTTGLSGQPTRFSTARRAPFLPQAGATAVMVDLDLALRLTADAPLGDRQVWLSRDDRAAEGQLTAALRQSGIDVTDRSTLAALERSYAGDGAVLALRLLVVSGAAAVLVAVGALLVAAYVGRRQRAYEVAALRAVGLRRRVVRGLLVRENLGTVLIALICGGLAAAVSTVVVLPSLPQFDVASRVVPVRYAPDVAAGWAALGGLAALLVTVGLLVAVLQLRTGRADRLREGVR